MNLQRRIGGALGASIILLGTTATSTTVPGCYTIRQVPIKQESEYPLRHSCSENVVCVDLYDDKAECKAVFNQPLIEKGYLPVFLLIRNKTQNKTYHLPRDNVKFTDSQARAWKQATSLEMSKHFHRIPGLEGAVIGVSFGAVAGVGAVISADRSNKDMDGDYSTKQLAEDTAVYPSCVASGFVYFSNPNSKGRSFTDKDLAILVNDARLNIPLVDTTENKTDGIEILLKPD